MNILPFFIAAALCATPPAPPKAAENPIEQMNNLLSIIKKNDLKQKDQARELMENLLGLLYPENKFKHVYGEHDADAIDKMIGELVDIHAASAPMVHKIDSFTPLLDDANFMILKRVLSLHQLIAQIQNNQLKSDSSDRIVQVTYAVQSNEIDPFQVSKDDYSRERSFAKALKSHIVTVSCQIPSVTVGVMVGDLILRFD